MIADLKFFHALPLWPEEESITDVGLSFSVIDRATADHTKQKASGGDEICFGSCFGMCESCCHPPVNLYIYRILRDHFIM